jgi:hypothetical protein
MFPMANAGFFKRQGGGFRFLADEVPSLTYCFSHLLCKASYAGNPWGQVNNGDQFFGADNFAVLPDAGGSDQALGLYNQVDGVLNQQTAGGYSGELNNFSEAYRVSGIPITNSENAFTYICVFRYPVSTRLLNQDMLQMGDVAGGDGGVRLSFLTTGRIETRIRRGNTIWERFEGVLNDDNLHILVWTYDGSLNRSGMKLYLDDMTTPLVPDTVSGSTITSGDYLSRQQYLCESGTSNEGLKQEFHLSDTVLSTTDLQTVKDILSQYYTFS